MKSIKNISPTTPNLPAAHSSKSHPNLPTIEPPLKESSSYPLRTRRQKIQVLCAFHPNEIITNFCKNSNCFLPLCPKCVKIHMEEHGELGTTGKFQSIQDCLDEVHQVYMGTFAQATRMQKTSVQIEQNYQAKKQWTLHQFQRLKLLAFDQLAQAFKTYQQALALQLTKQDKIFTENLIEYHDLMSTMMQGCRNGSKKFNNKATVMEGLIQFYSKGNYERVMKECQEKLRKIAITKLEISYHPEQLHTLDNFVKKYLIIGQTSTTMQKLQATKKLYKEIQQQYNQEQGVISGRYQQSTIGSHRNVGNGGNHSFVFGNFMKMESLLDGYSLDRSRRTRVAVEKKGRDVEDAVLRYQEA